MKQLATLSSIEGRHLLQKVYTELRYEKQLGILSILTQCWRICVRERELFRFASIEATVQHPLGILSGTSLWMQEIVNRHYFSVINSFVYLGAAFLLVVVGVRRFSDLVADSVVIASIAVESLLLVLMFIVMFFAPSDDGQLELVDDNEESESQLLVREVGEIARDYAVMSVQLENITTQLTDLGARQEAVISVMRDSNSHIAHAVAPNPDLLASMQETATVLRQFAGTVEQFNDTALTLRKEQIEFAVRKEVEKVIAHRLSNLNDQA